MNRDTFVQNIKFYCERKGLKPTSACKDAGVGTSFVTDIKRGQTPSVEKVEQLAHYLGTTVSVLIGESEPANPHLVEGLPPDALAVAKAYASVSPELQSAVRRVLGVG